MARLVQSGLSPRLSSADADSTQGADAAKKGEAYTWRSRYDQFTSGSRSCSLDTRSRDYAHTNIRSSR